MELTNYSTELNATTGAPESATQQIDFDQANNLTNTIVINNDGDIDPVVALSADISNRYVYLDNEALSFNDNTYDIGILSQFGTLDQANTLLNTLNLATSGNLVASVDGVSATISNDDVELVNEARAINGSDGQFVNLTQSAQIDQDNTLASQIVINNSGTSVTGIYGAFAEIDNETRFSGATLPLQMEIGQICQDRTPRSSKRRPSCKPMRSPIASRSAIKVFSAAKRASVRRSRTIGLSSTTVALARRSTM